MGDMYEPLGPVPAGDLPPPPPPPAAAANLDPLSHAPPQTKFENALGNANTSKTDLRSAPSAPVSKKGNSKDNKGGSKNNNKKNKSKQNSLKTEENVQDDDEEDEEQDGAERIKKMGFGKRANISITIASIFMAFSGVTMLIGIIGTFMGWTL